MPPGVPPAPRGLLFEQAGLTAGMRRRHFKSGWQVWLPWVGHLVRLQVLVLYRWIRLRSGAAVAAIPSTTPKVWM